MNVLALDTARRGGSVSLLRGGEPAVTQALGSERRHEQVLFGAVSRLLESHSLALEAIDVFAAATGPGSFTGIRVGLAAAKALAEAHGKPLVGVSSLRALAASEPDSRAALVDARRGELFVGCYDAGSRPLLPEMLGAWDDLEPRLRKLGATLVADDPSIFGPGGPAAAASGWPARVASGGLAEFVALLALRDAELGLGTPPEAVEANYIRRPSARPPGARPASR